MKQALDRKIAEQEKLKKEVTILKEKIQAVEDLKKELNMLFADPKKGESPPSTPK